MSIERIYLQKSWPYKLTCYFLYGSLPGVIYPTPGVVNLTLSEICKHLNIPHSRLRIYLTEMQRIGIIEKLTLTRGHATFSFIKPPNL
jgi:DNA-binding transcriptional regulator GbsR (MarR family)